MTAFVVVVCVILGFAVGSFLNVVIWRVPRHESIVAPPSHCPGCDQPISPRDNIPVVSWLVLRGKCRNCGEPIPVRYPMVEVGCAVLWGVIGYTFADSWALPAYLVLAAALLALSVIDLEHYLFRTASCSRSRVPASCSSASPPSSKVRATTSSAPSSGESSAFLALGVLHVISPRGMGLGDVKLAFVLGLYLGWLGWGEVFLGLFLGFLLGALIGVLLIATHLRSRKDHVPFGPFLAAGTLIAIIWGPALLGWYSQGR